MLQATIADALGMRDFIYMCPRQNQVKLALNMPLPFGTEEEKTRLKSYAIPHARAFTLLANLRSLANSHCS